MSGRYTVQISAFGWRKLTSLPMDIQRRLLDAVARLEDDPRPSSSKPLVGQDNLWRLRVGDYRVVYTILDNILVVLVVNAGHRKDVYR